jgi:hypothetical protein
MVEGTPRATEEGFAPTTTVVTAAVTVISMLAVAPPGAEAVTVATSSAVPVNVTVALPLTSVTSVKELKAPEVAVKRIVTP